MDRSGFASCVALSLALFAQHSFAGGVALSHTRVIYDGSKREASLTVSNKNTTEEYLIQSWIDDDKGNKKTPFIITPPLFKLNANKNNVLRIVNTSNSLPQDRESVYWVNVKAIPSKSEGASNNTLQIAVRTRLKLFYRPEGLKGRSMDGWNQLRFSQAGGNQIKVDNPSAFNLTFNKFSANGHDVEKTGMVPAKGSLTITLPAGTGNVSEVKYNIINDFGTSGDMMTQHVK